MTILRYIAQQSHAQPPKILSGLVVYKTGPRIICIVI